jgi:hypothetical protein
MSHYFEKTIVDAKDIYTNYLINMLSPLFYHGLKSMYDKAIEIEQKYIEAAKRDPNLVNPGSIVLFQHFLMELEKINDSQLEEETKRFRDNSGSADIFDDLIKAVIKSNIIVLTYTASNKSCKIIKEKLHEKIDPKTFIHKCYMECVKMFFDHPMLFFHKLQSNELKDNQRIIYQLIKLCIKNGINRCLPMKDILNEYLSHDYVEDEDEYINVKDMLKRDLENRVDDGGIMQILNSDSSSYPESKIKIRNIDDITALVYNRKIDDTLDGGTLIEDSELNKYDKDIVFDKPNINQVDDKVNSPEIEKNDNIKNNINKIISNGAGISDENIKKEKSIDIMSKMNTIRGRGKVKDNILQDAIINAKKQFDQTEKVDEPVQPVNIEEKEVDDIKIDTKYNADDAENHFGEEFD